MVGVSLVICTFNRADKLRPAIEAILRQKSVRQWEAILVDNASTDHTRDAIEEFARRDPRIRYVHEPQQGLGAARDTAWRHARGEIISFTDDDCYVAEDYVETIWQAFTDRADLGFIGGRILLHDPHDAPVTILTTEDCFDIPPYSYVAAGAIHGANLSFRRETLERIGGLSREMGAGTKFPCEDVDAIASAVWAGIAGGYDPRPTVSHHHGRKARDLPDLMQGYDFGRAAYFAKFISRRDSRKAYASALIREGPTTSVKDILIRCFRYAKSGTRYIRRHGKFFDLLLFACVMVRKFVRDLYNRVMGVMSFGMTLVSSAAMTAL